MVHYLVEETDCIIDHADFTGATALLKSMECSGDEPAIKLITAGANVNKATSCMLTPLHDAVRNKPRVAQLLIEHGADIDATEELENNTALHVAVEEGNYEMVCMLLYYGADAGIRNSYGLTPFMLSVSLNADTEIQELLLKYEVDVNMQDCEGFSTLLLAMNWQNPLILELVDRGANICYRKGLANVLNFLFTYEDTAIFDKVWCMIPLCLAKKAETDIRLLLDVQLADYDWHKRVKTVLTSDKAEYVIRKHNSILKHLIPACHNHGLKEEEVFPLVCICLMYGAEANYGNVLSTYRFYGYHDTLKQLLHMGITVNRSNEDLTLPYFICYVAPYARGYDSNCSMCIRIQSKIREMKDLLKYMTFIFTLCKSCRSLGVETEQVPSLRELSRLATRRAISLRFNTKNTLAFYTVVNNLNCPYIIKQLIGYEIPIL